MRIFEPLFIGHGNQRERKRIFIGEAFRHDVIYYPAVLVKQGSSKYVPISFNRNKETIQYCATKFVDGYGNETVTTTPYAFTLNGAWEGSFEIEIIARDILARDDISSILSLMFTDIRFEELLKAGVLIKDTSVSFSEDLDRKKERIYRAKIVLDIRSEWKREIPIGNIVDIINMCIDFGKVDTGVFAPNLTINTTVETE